MEPQVDATNGTTVKRGGYQTKGVADSSGYSTWGRRALLFTVIGVLIATLFPFQFFPKETAYRRTQSILHWLLTYKPAYLDVIDNIVFFFPLGFSLACWWQKRGWRRLILAWAAGVGLSLMVEYLQVFLPTRGAQWADVITNSTGSAVGFLIYLWAGPQLVRQAIRLEHKIERFFAPRRIAFAFILYAGLMLIGAAILQQSTNLAHWSPTDRLFIGADAAQHDSWHGQVLHVELADRAVSLIKFQEKPSLNDAPRREKASPLVPLLLNLSVRDAASRRGLRGEFPASDLVRHLRATGQFTIRVVCVPEEAAARSVGTLVRLSNGSGRDDFILGEYGGRWLAGIRSALGGKTRLWELGIANVPEPGKPLQFIVSYDGSRLSAAVDGKPSESIWLSPGAQLAGIFRVVKRENIIGYGILFDGLFFAPLGFLLALAARKQRPNAIWIWLFMLLPPMLLQLILGIASRQPFRPAQLFLGETLIIGAFLLLNLGWKAFADNANAQFEGRLRTGDGS